MEIENTDCPHTHAVFFNIPDNEIVEERHICWFTRDASSIGDGKLKIALYEVVEVFFRNPQAKDVATVSCIQTRDRGVFDRLQPDNAFLVIMEAAQNNIRKAVLRR